MGARILTLQMQARELGRLRTGVYVKPDKGRGHPTRSRTWIFTSPAEHYVKSAADEWGGTVEKWQPQGNGAQQFRVITKAEAIDAILPPGDPLSQSLEMWSKGGCQRRCDGLTEALSNSPCLCVEDYGPEFWKVAAKDDICKMTTRLNVILPSMPDIGLWRVETGSYWGANEIAAAVDMLKAAAGESAMIPIRLRIEQRTRVSQGQTKHYPVIAVELRGATAGQVLEAVASTAAVGAVASTQARAAIETARPDYVAQAEQSSSPEEFRAVVDAAEAAGHMDDVLRQKLGDVWKAKTATPPAPVGNAVSTEEEAEVVSGEVVEDVAAKDRLWALCIENAPQEWDAQRLKTEFAGRNEGLSPFSASEQQLRAFLSTLTDGAR